MTIALGMLCKEGVLLCADTEEVAWVTKSHGLKIRDFTFPGGRVAFAYAGSVDFALSAIEKCRRRLNAMKRPSAFQEIECILYREYRRNVLRNPRGAEFDYMFLIGLWEEGSDTAALYVTSQTAIRPVDGFECIGIGESLARHLVGGVFRTGMPHHKALPLAAYALTLVKDQMRDCDGLSLYGFLSNAGEWGLATSAHNGPCADAERHAKAYSSLSRTLLMDILDPFADSENFARNLKSSFIGPVNRMFNSITEDRKRRERMISEANPSFDETQVRRVVYQASMGLPINPKGPLYPELTKADPSPPPPSPESPGESDES